MWGNKFKSENKKYLSRKRSLFVKIAFLRWHLETIKNEAAFHIAGQFVTYKIRVSSFL